MGLRRRDTSDLLSVINSRLLLVKNETDAPIFMFSVYDHCSLISSNTERIVKHTHPFNRTDGLWWQDACKIVSCNLMQGFFSRDVNLKTSNFLVCTDSKQNVVVLVKQQLLNVWMLDLNAMTYDWNLMIDFIHKQLGILGRNVNFSSFRS